MIDAWIRRFFVGAALEVLARPWAWPAHRTAAHVFLAATEPAIMGLPS